MKKFNRREITNRAYRRASKAAQAVSIEIYQAFCDKSGAEDTAGIVW